MDSLSTGDPQGKNEMELGCVEPSFKVQFRATGHGIARLSPVLHPKSVRPKEGLHEE